ncbi:unnamed protein product [Rhizophagus irregularis]|nr:unnamed protein product [Rhizophagus irregularis]
MVKEKLSFITLVGVPMSLSIFSETYCITSRHPKNAPEWAYKTQNMPVDTDFSGPDIPAENHESQSQTDDNTQTEHND